MDVTKDFHEALGVIYEFAVVGCDNSINSTKKLDKARSKVITLFADTVNVYKLLDRVLSERDDLRELVEIKVQEIQELRRPIDEHTKPLHAEIESLKSELEGLGKRANSEYAARLSADNAAAKASEQSASLVTRIADQRTEIAKLQAALSERDVALNVERNRADTERLKHRNASAAAGSLQQQLTDLRSTVMARDIEEHSALVLRLKTEIETQRGAKQRNAAELAEVRRELESELVSVRAALKDYQRIADERWDEIAKLNRLLANAERGDENGEGRPEAPEASSRDLEREYTKEAARPPARGTVWVLLKGREGAVTFEADERCLGTYVEALRTNEPFTYIEGGGVQHFIPVASIETLSFKAESAS